MAIPSEEEARKIADFSVLGFYLDPGSLANYMQITSAVYKQLRKTNTQQMILDRLDPGNSKTYTRRISKEIADMEAFYQSNTEDPVMPNLFHPSNKKRPTQFETDIEFIRDSSPYGYWMAVATFLKIRQDNPIERLRQYLHACTWRSEDQADRDLFLRGVDEETLLYMKHLRDDVFK